MAILEALDEDEAYLISILLDESGLDLAEFSWKDDNNPDGCWRAWPFQWKWYRCTDRLQADHASRSLGKSVSIQLRGFIFPFVHPGMEMLITAPELIHLQPVTSAIENRIMSIRLSREMLDRKNRGTGFTHQPFGAQFSNGARIMGRIPQRDGRGVKGCAQKGQLVLTRRGSIPIEEVIKGDEVLTHMGRWKRVVANYKYVNADGYRICGGGNRELVVSDTHRMWARRNASICRTVKLSDPRWVVVDDPELPERWYLGSPTSFPSEPIPAHPFSDLKSALWIVGRYVADGHIQYEAKISRRFNITVKDSEVNSVVDGCTRAGLKSSVRFHHNDNVSGVEVCSNAVSAWLKEQFGSRAESKTVPIWLLGAPEEYRREWLNGYLSGDGHWDGKKLRWTSSSASRQLSLGVKLLAQSIGYSTGFSWVDPKVTHIQGVKLKGVPRRSFRVTMSEHRGKIIDGYLWNKIRKIEPVEKIEVYDLSVEDDHSYILDGLVSHNQHPLWLEADEMQDYPEPGWIELNETLRYGQIGSVWRTHGVSTGVRNKFYEYTQPESGWTVHRLTAMLRPDWSDEEREQKILLYGGRNSPDYKRNILGEHGDQTNPLFVLARLMSCCDESQGSDYNQNEYVRVDITEEKLKQSGWPIEEFIKVPASHYIYPVVWIGVDIGFTNHPSEVLVFAEEPKQRGSGGTTKTIITGTEMVMKLVSRWHLERISAPDQRRVLHELARIYKPKAISLDSTGNGLPIYQDMMAENPSTATLIKGYNFSSKVAVDWEDGENIDDSLIMRNVLEHASDKLREYVDAGWIKLPWDLELIKEWQGQSYTLVKTTMNPYGKREFSRGSFHSLDAGRMAILGKVLDPIEKMLGSREDSFGGIMDLFYG